MCRLGFACLIAPCFCLLALSSMLFSDLAFSLIYPQSARLLPASVRRETDHAIACVAHRLTRTRRRELYESGQLDCKTIYWRVHTLMQWPKILPDDSHCTHIFANESHVRQFVRPREFAMQCPRQDCNHKQNAARSSLWSGSHWKQLACKHCGRCKSGGSGRCMCGVA